MSNDFTLAQVATLGLPEGQYIVQITDIEAGVSNTSNSKITLKAKVLQSEKPDLVGKPHIWSYTWQKEWVSIFTNDLIRAGLPKDFTGSYDANVHVERVKPHLLGRYLIINVKAQRNDPTRNNTSITGPYEPTATGQMPAPAMAAPAMGAALPGFPQGSGGPPTIPQGFPAAGFPAAPYAPPPSALPPTAPGGTLAQPGTMEHAYAQAMHAAVPQAAVPVPQAVQEEGLATRPDLLQAIMANQRPPLNGTQIAQLDAIFPAVAAEYLAAQQVASVPPPQVAPPAAGFPAAPAPGAPVYGAV